jgi:glycosyltransferase involved in cell wall biosynthesis
LLASSHFLPDVLPVYVLKLLGGKHIKAAVYVHHIVQDMNRPKTVSNLLANIQERFCLWLVKNKFDKVIVVNADVAGRLRAMGRSPKVFLSSNFVEAPSALKNHGKFTISYCGRMVKQKGIYDFLNIVEQLQHKFDDFSAVMVGIGPELDNVRNEIQRRNLQVSLAGYVDDTTKLRFIRDSQLFVFPSYEEGWGIVIAEALSQGTAALAYDLPVYSDVFGDAIKTVPIGKWRALSETGATLLTRYRSDPDTREQDASRLRAFAARFERDAVAEQELTFLVGE